LDHKKIFLKKINKVDLRAVEKIAKNAFEKKLKAK